MSLDYLISANVDQSPAQIGSLLIQRCGHQRIGEVSHVRVARSGIICDLLPAGHIHRELVQSTFQIDCQLTIHCNIDKFEDYDAGMAGLRDVVALMLSMESEFVVLANGENGVLLRSGGQITLDAEPGEWRQEWELMLNTLGLFWASAALPVVD